MTTRDTRQLLLPMLLIVMFATSGCAIFVSLPETPGLGNLSEGQVFAMAAPATRAAAPSRTPDLH